MKKIISVILVVMFALTAFACGEQKKLATPANVTLSEDGTLSWDAVPEAEGYIVVINDQENPVETNSYKIDNMGVQFSYCVIATAKNYKNSDKSEVKTHVIEQKHEKITLALEGKTQIKKDGFVELERVMKNQTDSSVTWTIKKGKDIANLEVLDRGRKAKITLKDRDIEGGSTITIRCTSREDPSVYAEKVISVMVKPELTQNMLDLYGNSTNIKFDGYMNIDLYKLGEIGGDQIVSSVVSSLKTVAGKDKDNIERWYAEYESGAIAKGQLFYKNDGDLACQVSVDLMNEESTTPIKDEEGNEISWIDSGFYNNFKGLNVSDFKFNEETWQYEYIGTNDKLVERMIACANPYDFNPKFLALIVEDNEIVGITSKSEPNYKIAPGHRAEQELIVTVSLLGKDEDVPVLGKFEPKTEEAKAKIKRLNDAVKNMQALTNYTLDLEQAIANLQNHLTIRNGYTEYLNSDHFMMVPYENQSVEGKIEKVYNKEAVKGYKKINENLYNSYVYTKPEINKNSDGSKSNDTVKGEFIADRAYEGSINKVMPSFAFAGEIFTSYKDTEYKETEDSEVTKTATSYYVSESMMKVATTFFFDVLGHNDMNLYGLFAAKGYLSATEAILPFVTVKDINIDGIEKPYITESGFYFDMGILRGIIIIKYSDFGTTTMPTDINVEFKERQVPTKWTDETFKVRPGFAGNETNDEIEMNAVEFFKKFYEDENIENHLPYMGIPLGDSFGFAHTDMLENEYGNRSHVLRIYYDIPVEIDYTLTKSFKRAEEYLLSIGYTEKDGEYYKVYKEEINPQGKTTEHLICLRIADEGLDCFVYMWKDVRVKNQ